MAVFRDCHAFDYFLTGRKHLRSTCVLIRRSLSTNFEPTLTVAENKKIVPVIGLEIHAQLYCATKLFSSAPSGSSINFAARANAQPFTSAVFPSNGSVALFDLATPGTLPRLNYQSVQQCLRASVLLHCNIPKFCRFDRKHYFYPDLPLGYQITQKDFPIAESGYFDFYVYSSMQPFAPLTTKRKAKNASEEKRACLRHIARCGIERLQLEIDSGKLLKYEDTSVANDLELIDLNRAGIALIEIVTAPDFHSARDAVCFVEQLRELLYFNGICEGEMHKGNLRVDANVSISIDDAPGVRTEIKNINSFRYLQGAIENEIIRQCMLIRKGETVIQETRNLNTETLKTTPTREKGDGLDYRFTPELNLPNLQIKSEWIEDARRKTTYDLPYLKYIEDYNFPPSFALQLARDKELKHFIDMCFTDLSGIEFAKFYDWMLEYKRICEANNQHFPPNNDHAVNSFRHIIRLEHEGKLTRAISFDLLKLYSSPDITMPQVSLLEKVQQGKMWRIHDVEQIELYIETTIEKQPELFKKALANPTVGNKHFNRLRNEVVIASGKRLDVSDVGEVLLQKLAKNAKR